MSLELMRLRCVIIAMVWMPLPTAVCGQSVIADAPANSWIEVPNTMLRAVVPQEDEFPGTWGVCGPRSVIDAWSGAALDTKRSRLLVFGGGHADYGGNELYAFDIPRLEWQRLTDPFPNPQDDSTDQNPDGTPQSRHTYGGLSYLSHNDRFFALGGAVYRSGNSVCDKVWTFDLANERWERDTTAAPFRPAYDCTCAYDPETGTLWYCNYDGGSWAQVWGYNTDREWRRLPTEEDRGYAGVALDTRRGRLVVLSEGIIKAYDVRGDSPVETWDTTGGDDFLRQRQVGFEYDPVADRLVGWSRDRVYVLDPESKTWTVNNPPGAPEPSENGTYGRWRYVRSVNAYILVTGIDENVHFYKLTPGVPD
jgi:hypothetical protein